MAPAKVPELPPAILLVGADFFWSPRSRLIASSMSQILSKEGRSAGRLLQQLSIKFLIAGSQCGEIAGPSPLYLAPTTLIEGEMKGAVHERRCVTIKRQALRPNSSARVGCYAVRDSTCSTNNLIKIQRTGTYWNGKYIIVLALANTNITTQQARGTWYN